MQATLETLPRLFRPAVPAAPHPVATVRASVFLPKEHGSWSLAFEPLALGLLLAPSAPGVSFLAIAMAGFFIRRPFKAAFLAQHSDQRREARETLVMLMALALTGAFEVLVLGAPEALWPLLFALPCGALFAYFDGQGEGRAAAAEVAGSAAFAMLPAVFATLAGWSEAAALSLAAVAMTRSIPAVLTIRTFLRQRKGESVGVTLPILAGGLGLGLVILLAALGPLPWPATGGALLMLIRTIWLNGPWRPAWTARRAGITETFLGLAYLILVVSAYAWVGRIPPSP